MRAANIQEYYDLNQQITFEILKNQIEITELSRVISKLQFKKKKNFFIFHIPKTKT